MKPLLLRLKGFCGIRDGLGREELTLDFEALVGDARLIAISGANGRGKTTIMDNMHPYLIMPSQAINSGQGGFSYYLHVYLPESEKELIWEYDGQRYKSHIIFRIGRQNKTEAYLFIRTGNSWREVVLADGTRSDGKVGTYEHCVETICGSADTFFTSVFSPQGKRQLATYENSKIKTLLADLLGHNEVREYGLKAAEVVKQLKKGLAIIRVQQVEWEKLGQVAAAEQERLVGAEGRLVAASSERAAAQLLLDQSHALLMKLQGESEQARLTDDKQRQLSCERKAVEDENRRAIESLELREDRENQRLLRLERKIADRQQRSAAQRQMLQCKRKSLLETLALAHFVQRAVRRLPLAETILKARTVSIELAQSNVKRLLVMRERESALCQKISAIEREAGQASLRVAELSKRFALTDEVPCVGTDLQGRCKLLTDAMAAKAILPSADLTVSRLSDELAVVKAEYQTVRAGLDTLSNVEVLLAVLESRIERTRNRIASLTALSARSWELAQADAAVAELDKELSALNQDSEKGETQDEIAERAEIAANMLSIANERTKQVARFGAQCDFIGQALAALPPLFDQERLTKASGEVECVSAVLKFAETKYAAAIRDLEILKIADQQAVDMIQRVARYSSHAAKIERELGAWSLFAKCFGNDGIIALSIDDAGPALSSLTNDLLLACYGSRFTVSIQTVVETAKSEQREGFDIIVNDSSTGRRKSVTLMSGGERIWVNESLVRAIAVYLSLHAGRVYSTLFSDEVDGPLDSDRKRMFIAMKREILRLGRYQQEFFVSQTPELTALADKKIDLDLLAEQVDCA